MNTKIFELKSRNVVVVPRYGKNSDVEIHDMPKELLTPEAEFAADLIRHWGMVAATDDGEDSAGRHQLKLQDVPDVVSRAVSMTKGFFAAIRTEGWVMFGVDPREIYDLTETEK